MTDDPVLPFILPAVGGVMLLAAAERRLSLAARLAGVITDHRDPARITHRVADILRARMLAIACGYEDADDLDHLRGVNQRAIGTRDQRPIGTHTSG